ncbi:hypothetical protein GYMLUDRAFT_59655 [Collybiopsis luxurians FD-317 M1]|uniref:Uncharacterized protein n=1 Tax=Collybiopsis luxurians FD-317 M1 TaxID=944289 RepID=A0A0D0CVU2_9AGAR|nr:hypothetical protein GYMLUDRAFT_59655 [Collybiopsis luxurians FD-317 M1]
MASSNGNKIHFNRFLSCQVIIYNEQFALRLLERDVQIAEEEPSVEYCLYALISRIIPDLCLVAHLNQEESNGEEKPIVLQAHNQAYFGYTVEMKNPITGEVGSQSFWRLSDNAAMIFHVQSPSEQAQTNKRLTRRPWESYSKSS